MKNRKQIRLKVHFSEGSSRFKFSIALVYHVGNAAEENETKKCFFVIHKPSLKFCRNTNCNDK